MPTRTELFTRSVSLLLLIALSPATSRGAPSAGLATLCDEYWQGLLRAQPTFATSIGDRRFDDQLEDITPAAIERERQRLEGVLSRARAFDSTGLDDADRLNRAALVETIEGQLANLSCHFEDWVVDPLGGPQVEFFNLPDYTVIATPKDAARFVARCRAMGKYFDDHIANLRSGLGAGRVAAHDCVQKVAEELDSLAAKPVSGWALMSPAAASHPSWTRGEREHFRADLTAALRDVVKPAIVRYRDAIEKEVVPAARPAEKSGLVNLPGGLECYRKRIREETSLDATPEELHQLGLDELKRIREALSSLGEKVLGTRDVAEIQRRLRTDPAMHFKSAEEVEAKARETLARAKAAIPGWFHMLPRADCKVKV